MKKLVRENANILKPKDLSDFIGRSYYYMNSASGKISVIFKINEFTKTKGFDITIIFNDENISGGHEINQLSEGENLNITLDAFRDWIELYGWREVDKNIIKMLAGEIFAFGII